MHTTSGFTLLSALFGAFGALAANIPVPITGALFGQVGEPRSFDYVIVGAGPAGLTLAARLAKNFSVALIEAGGTPETDEAAAGTIPAEFPLYQGKHPVFLNPLTDWNQKTTTQVGLNNVSVLYNTGKTLGGSSVKAAIFHQRPTIGDCHKWAELVNDSSYEFENLLPFFQKSISFTPPNDQTRASNATPQFNTSSFRAAGGPVQVTYPNYASPGASWTKNAMEEIGLHEIDGFQDGDLLGSSYSAFAQDPVTQERSNAWRAWQLPLTAAFPNATIYQRTLAKRILFDSSQTATGVEVEVGTQPGDTVSFVLNATKEVIVSAGAFRSPQLLMVSGIGPSDVLRAHGIDVIADRAGVGQNMWDHPWFGVSHEMDLLSHSWLLNPLFQAEALEEYALNRTGILTNSGGDILGEKHASGTVDQLTCEQLSKSCQIYPTTPERPWTQSTDPTILMSSTSVPTHSLVHLTICCFRHQTSRTTRQSQLRFVRLFREARYQSCRTTPTSIRLLIRHG
jgi:choline dehydrogenase